MMNATFLVKILQAGTRILEVGVDSTFTVRRTLEAGGVTDFANMTIRINNNNNATAANLDTIVREGDVIVLTSNVKGGC